MREGEPPPVDPQRPDARLLLLAYQQGWFPMADLEHGVIEWFSPDPRAIIELDTFHVPSSLRRVVRQRRFEIRCDTAFEQVMRECATPRPGPGGGVWIDDRLIEAYVDMHERGAAHSIEAWREGDLVGGLYGVSLRGAFFGESMFSRPGRGGRDASKVCLVHLVGWLRHCGATLLDTQFWNPHLDQFGCQETPRRVYLRRLEAALAAPVGWGVFDASVASARGLASAGTT